MQEEQFSKRVLIVDDDPTVRQLLTSKLNQLGLVVDQAADGNHALELIATHQYVVILLDLLMPVADGFTVLDGLRKGGDPQSPPVVLVLTGADRRTIDRLDAQHIHGVVKKPFDPHEIGALVLACAEIKSRSSFGTMAIATMLSGAPLLALLTQHRIQIT